MVALDLSSKSCCQDVLLNTKIVRGTLDLNLKKIWQKNWGTFKSYSLFLKGEHLSQILKMIHRAQLMILSKKARFRDICLTRDKIEYFQNSYVPPTMIDVVVR